MNVGSHLRKRAELNPALEALVDDTAGRRFTFAELDERADRAARVLTGPGLARATGSPCCCPPATSSSRCSTARPGPGWWSCH
ncbi:fatty-acid-CoA ligase fadD13 domain protein [Mycobacterium kansasii]|uniref:Fatty-acid-CoA ligase fadD13 domain protein n=1 Tax=Mycobacterium kansasii TaxID=1768 RepID=A0A1V3WIR6_MYCKA|nr:fatty-acid-CoA ligase fadD13 domain protein [Mycobacterium kansasii]